MGSQNAANIVKPDKMSLQLPGPSAAVSIGARVYPKSVHACIIFNAMLVSHGPLKNFSRGEEKGTMGLLMFAESASLRTLHMSSRISEVVQ
jgi:hypothetical protein